MNREAFVNLMMVHNDAYINYHSPVSKKSKYYVGTLDFINCEYVNKMYKAKFNTNPPTAKDIRNSKENAILVWCWDLNDFKTVDISSVTSIDALSDVLKNVG